MTSKLHLFSAAYALLVFSAGASAQVNHPSAALAKEETSRSLVSPPEMTGQALTNNRMLPCTVAGEPRAANGVDVSASLKISRSQHTIYNPTTGQNDQVELRTYNDCLTGPTIRLRPGDRFHLNVENTLSAQDPSCPADLANHNDPNCFNSGNIHTHGLHVSPDGNADNVLLTIPPQSTFHYVYDLPLNHPAGTFWYHSHRHGSTSLSVSSGMEGVIVVEGTRRVQDKKTPDDIADIDTILRDLSPQHRTLKEQIFLFQQIAYGCFQKGQNPFPNAAPKQNSSGWFCDPGDVGVVENYPQQFGFPNGADAWSASKRFTEINGKVQPKYVVPAAGQIERWRLVHGGVRDTINLQITKTNASALQTQVSNGKAVLDAIRSGAANVSASQPLALPTTREALQTFVSSVCDANNKVPQFELAVDGLTRNHLARKTLDTNVLQPGYRSDILVAFPDPGLYCVLDQRSAGPTTIIPEGTRLGAKDPQLLAIVEVDGTRSVNIDQTWLLNQLLQANSDLPAAVKTRIAAGDLSDFAPHRDLSGVQIAQSAFADFNFLLFNRGGVTTIPPSPTPVQAVLLGQAAIAPTLAQAQALVANTNPASLPNASSYNPAVVNWTGTLDTVDEWTVTSETATHVFHIHVNPFEIITIKKNGTSIFDATGHCTELDVSASNPTADPEYCDLFDTPGKPGVFRDTVFIKPGYQVVFRTKYEQPWVGEFVMHCHILDHEDQGMMQNVVITNGAPFMTMENMTMNKKP